VRRVKESGVAILYISHHLEEVYEICDRATVLRDGRWIVTAPVAGLGREALVRAMVGEDVVSAVSAAKAGDDASPSDRLRVLDLTVRTPLGSAEGVSFSVAAGECLGLFGARGSGASAIADAVAGLVKPAEGRIELDGTPLRPGKVDAAIERGVGYVPEDRHARGFVPTLGVEENLTLPLLRRFSRLGLVSGGRRRAAAHALVHRLEVVASGPDQPVAELSGGNQQKVAVGRALAGDPSLLVVVSPTVGVDIASKEALLGVINDARERGTAVLLVSDDLDDLRICTRVMVVHRGVIVRELRERPWDHHELIAAAEGLEVAV
jgi:simple sugar transport system ATP-binding protein